MFQLLISDLLECIIGALICANIDEIARKGLHNKPMG